MFSVGTFTEKGSSLLGDCFTKLCRIPFPVEAARASVVMHYEEQEFAPTLLFRCNAAIHAARVNPPKKLRIKGMLTAMYAVVNVTPDEDDEARELCQKFEGIGYIGTYNSDTGKLYICWDEHVSNPGSEQKAEP